MNAWTYKAALYCDKCALLLIQSCRTRGSLFWPRVMQDDSEHFPQGPYPNGGGEADSPQHCDSCHVFLENPLTLDGIEYVRDTLERDDKHANREVLNTWREFYRDSLESFP